MSEKPAVAEKAKGLLSGIKWAVDHGKAVATAVGIVTTLAASAYASFRPEEDKKAEDTYAVLKQPVEEAVNRARENEQELAALKARLDVYEKLLVAMQTQMAANHSPSALPLSKSTPQPVVSDLPSLLRPPPSVDGDGIADVGENLVLPDRPWEQRKR